MTSFTRRLKHEIINLKFQQGTLFSEILLELLIFCAFSLVGAYPGVHVDGYQELEEPFYPFQQYIQVRKTFTVEHVPAYHNDAHSANSPQQSASTNGRDHLIPSATHSGSSGDYYEVPRLKAEISDYKKQEVYEEKGYGDAGYDHRDYRERGHGEYDHHEPHEPMSEHNDYQSEQDGVGSSTSAASASSPSASSKNLGKRGKPREQRHRSLHTPDGSSTKILEYVAATQHDKDAQEKGIYAARDHIYCPEVIDFDLSSMAMGEGGRGAKPRLKGLGSKIKCLKEKYFGKEPLPKAIFDDPAESQQSVIQVPSFSNFYKVMRENVDSMSSFQNSKIPI